MQSSGGREPEVISEQCMLGEAPVWDSVRERLNWVDCDRKKLFRLDPKTSEIRSFDLPGHPGSYALCADGKLLMAYRTSLALMDPDAGAQQVIETPMVDFAKARFNDGACDRAGRFWVGTMHKTMSEPVGALYRVDPDLSIRQMADGVTVSNGIAFSPDDKVMYHTDSRAAVIHAYDFDLGRGEIANRRVFAAFGGGAERPDGCTVDSEGFVWAAMLGGGRIAVLNPKGEQVRSIPLPTSRPTSLCFGGRNLDTLYVTSMRHGLSAEELSIQPDAGCVFAFAGIGRGLPEPYFAGG